MEAPVVLLFKSRGWWGPTHGGTHIKRAPDRESGAHGVHPQGPYGPIFYGYRHNAKGAIEKLRHHKTGEAIAALYHPEVGDIDLVWGKTSDNPRAKGFGLAKLLRWHPEMVDDLQKHLLLMRVHQKHGDVLHLRGGTFRGAIKLTFDEQQKHWLLTAYDSDSEGASDRTPALSDADAVEMNPAPSNSTNLTPSIHRVFKKSITTVVVFKRTAQG